MNTTPRQSLRSHRPSDADDRRGMVLVVVLVVVALLSLGVYAYSERMLSEAEATAMYSRGIESRMFAESGIEAAAAYLGSRVGDGSDNFYDNPALFQAVLMRDGVTDRGRGRFSIIVPMEADITGRSLRYGLADESGKLNLNALMQANMTDEQRQAALMWLPGMTPDIADAILDFLDTDDTPRAYGAESEYYQSLSPPYAAKNGPLQSLDELLLVRGIIPAMIYGEDANRNGLLDGNENDGDASLPIDNGDGILDPGWSSLLTVSSRESNLSFDGTAKINLNNGMLTDLYDQLEAEFGEEIATFVIAYRSSGPYDPNSSSGGNSSGGNVSGNSGGGGQGGRGGRNGRGGRGPGGQGGRGQGGQGGGGGPGQNGMGPRGGGGGGGGGNNGGRGFSPGGGGGGGGQTTGRRAQGGGRGRGGAGGGENGGGGNFGGGGFGGRGGGGGGFGQGGGGFGGGGRGGGGQGGSGQGGGGRGGQGQGGGGRGGGGGGRGGGGFPGGQPNVNVPPGLQQAAQGIASAVFGGGSGSVTRGGMNVSNGGNTKINSIYDLIGVQVQVDVNGQKKVLDSPWQADPASLEENLPTLFNRFATSTVQYYEGRININEARMEVLLGVPGMTEEQAEAIVMARAELLGSAGSAISPLMTTTGWLLAEGIATLEQMRTWAPFLTARGDVYRVQSIGYFDAGGPVVRLEAMIDASQVPPRVSFLRDITHLGRGYTREQLNPAVLTGNAGPAVRQSATTFNRRSTALRNSTAHQRRH